MPPQRLTCTGCGYAATRYRDLSRHRCSRWLAAAPYPQPLLSLTIPETRPTGSQPQSLLSLVVRPPVGTTAPRPLLSIQLRPPVTTASVIAPSPTPLPKPVAPPPPSTPCRPLSPVASLPVPPSESPLDSWMQEDVCDVLLEDELANGPKTPAYCGPCSPSTPETSPLPPSFSPHRLLTPTRFRPVPTADAAVQAEIIGDTRDRVRRRVFHDGRPTIRLRPVPARQPHEPADTDTRVRVDQRRRLCCCQRCIRHATRLADTDLAAETPPIQDLELVTLQGLPVHLSSVEDRRRLLDHLRRSPQKLLLVCGCASCTSHRNFDAAVQEVWKHTPVGDMLQPPPEAGGCRAPPSNNCCNRPGDNHR